MAQLTKNSAYVDVSDSGSISDDLDGGGSTSTPGEDASNEQIREALKREQLKNQKLMTVYKKLKGESTKASGKRGRKTKPDDNASVQLAEHHDLITRLGKKCTVMLSIWLPEGVYTKPRPMFDYTDAAQRYRNTQNQELALIAELYDFVPESMHVFLRGLPLFADIFKGGASACRSSTLYNIRNNAATIFELDAKYFRGDHAVKDCDMILKLLGYNKATNKYDLWAPILYPNNTKNMRQTFRNPSLPLILKVALFGAGALNAVAKGKPKVNAQLWNVTTVNESAIAYAAIMGRFVLSKDTEFNAVGAATGIKYESDFWKYRKVLASVDDSARQDLFDFYNEIIFPTRSQVPTKKKSLEDDEEDLTDAIAAFNLGPVIDYLGPIAEDMPSPPASPLSAISTHAEDDHVTEEGRVVLGENRGGPPDDLVEDHNDAAGDSRLLGGTGTDIRPLNNENDVATLKNGKTKKGTVKDKRKEKEDKAKEKEVNKRGKLLTRSRAANNNSILTDADELGSENADLVQGARISKRSTNVVVSESEEEAVISAV